MRPYVFIVVLLAAGVSGYGIWTILGDSWLLPSIAGAFWGWIGCTIANLGQPVVMLKKYPVEALAFQREQDALREKAHADYVSAAHSARSFKR